MENERLNVNSSLLLEELIIAEIKQKEADEFYKREYGPRKTRIMIPAKQDKKKMKNKRKTAKNSKRKNRN